MAAEQSPGPAARARELLLIDAGNSRIKWALAGTDGVLRSHGALAHEPLAQAPQDAELAAAQPAGAWVSNVAGAAAAQRITAWLEAQWPGLPQHTVRACAQQCGVRNRYDTPTQLGSDRWASLIGAHAAYPGEHLLIATCGTATTLEFLHADGSFDGGLIAPGLRLMMQALGEHTAQLPQLQEPLMLDQAPPAGPTPAPAPGRADAPLLARETRASIARGCLLAQAALIERVWRDCGAQRQAPVRLLLGGGGADPVATVLGTPYTRHDNLVLEGLARIATTPAAAPTHAQVAHEVAPRGHTTAHPHEHQDRT
jgi:type III pantothenate kinase